ncbi:hypothetical protein V6U81_22250 [Micromonospora sp. CPCC 205711]|uniref:hypothetical protein n=1 Tax=Micromonospora sp. CPCC 205547 TaxID=3122400 RepID=UPI002FEFE019
MAARGWGGSVATAIGVAAGMGAAQLGFGYGLGIINWAPAGAGTTEATWFASLAWATWIAAVSTVVGAVCAQRLHERGGATDETGGGLHRATLAVAGAVGALITVLLVAVPARAAIVPDTFSPQSLAAGYAGIGVLVGLLTAVWALRSRAAANNVIATVGWLWLLAVVSVVDGVLAGRGLTAAQLGIWQISHDRAGYWLRDYLYWPGALLAVGSALVIGALAARRTARSSRLRLGAAVSGAAGPLLVAIAYFLAVPRLATIAPEQVSAHLVAPYAVIVGAAGSILVVALAQRAELRDAGRDTVAAVPRPRTGEHDDRPATAEALPAIGAEETTGRRNAASRGDTVDDRTTTTGRASAATPADAAAVTLAEPPPAEAETSGGQGTATGATGRARPPRRTRSASSTPTISTTEDPALDPPTGPPAASGTPTDGLPTGEPTAPRPAPRPGRRPR